MPNSEFKTGNTGVVYFELFRNKLSNVNFVFLATQAGD